MKKPLARSGTPEPAAARSAKTATKATGKPSPTPAGKGTRDKPARASNGTAAGAGGGGRAETRSRRPEPSSPSSKPFADKHAGPTKKLQSVWMTSVGTVVGLVVGFAAGTMSAPAAPDSPGPSANAVAPDSDNRQAPPDSPADPATAAGSGRADWENRLYEVEEYVDGDTFRIDFIPPSIPKRYGVRMLNINTPELRRGNDESKKLGREAADKLQELLSGKKIRLEFEHVGDWHADNFGRLLAYVFVGDKNINVEMVRLGYSKYDTRFERRDSPRRYHDQFQKAENEARNANRGIWALGNNVELPDD